MTPGDEMYAWAKDLFPIARSLTGPGVRETLAYLKRLLPALEVLEVPSGTRAFDWTVPDEWTIRDAYIADESGARVVDYRASNLHVVSYSVPVDTWMTRAELDAHLHSRPDLPDVIPYITGYYARTWGFSLPHAQRVALPDGRYHVVIDSTLAPGVMNAGEAVFPGRSNREVLFSANVCHPSLANNELSGMLVLTALARWIRELPDRRFTYRFLFIPETIGSIWYVSTHLQQLKQNTIAGFVVTCAGDDRAYSYLPSRAGNTLADRIALRVLERRAPDFRKYSYSDRGSDERQYGSPGVDLPVCSIMRTKYAEYPEYHTSLDDLRVISPAGLGGSFDILRACVEELESARIWTATTLCEPQLSLRGLYPELSTGRVGDNIRMMMDVLAYADGSHDVVSLAAIAGCDVATCTSILEMLESHGLVTTR